MYFENAIMSRSFLPKTKVGFIQRKWHTICMLLYIFHITCTKALTNNSSNKPTYQCIQNIQSNDVYGFLMRETEVAPLYSFYTCFHNLSTYLHRMVLLHFNSFCFAINSISEKKQCLFYHFISLMTRRLLLMFR